MLSAKPLLERLRTFPEVGHYWVAYSGGVDSRVLLHLLAGARSRLPVALGAVHVDHGLQAAAADWGRHCRAVCRHLDVPLVELQAAARPAPGESPEAAARRARYAALENWLPAGHGLLTAQHEDDQAETLLLQLLRGSGVKGLAAMPAVTVLGGGLLLRPLLGVSRQSLVEHAHTCGLEWIEDPSNRDTGLDRNFLRHRILPTLRRRWPSVTDTIARSARHCAEADCLLEELAATDLRSCTATADNALQLGALGALTPEHQRNALRHWLHGCCGLLPSTAVLARIRQDLLDSRPDASPCVRWAGYELHRYRDSLFLTRPQPVPDPQRRLHWSLDRPLELPGNGGILSVQCTPGHGLRMSVMAAGGVEIGYRRGGERCRPLGRQHHHALKKLFQEAGVPPWQRPHIPLIFVDNTLAAVAGYWVCAPFAARAGEPGLSIEWSGLPLDV